MSSEYEEYDEEAGPVGSGKSVDYSFLVKPRFKDMYCRPFPVSCRRKDTIDGVNLIMIDSETVVAASFYVRQREATPLQFIATLGLNLADLNRILPALEGDAEGHAYFSSLRDLAECCLLAVWQDHRGRAGKEQAERAARRAERKYSPSPWGTLRCDRCNAPKGTWADSARGVCSLCGHPL